MTRVDELAPRTAALHVVLARTRTPHVALASFALLLVLHASTLAAPPYWDALLGAFPQAHWLAQHGLSSRALLESGGTYVDGGACVYPFSVVPTILGALEVAGASARTTFLAAHVVNLACAALAIAGTFALVRALSSATLAVFAAAALFAWPPFQGLAAQMSLDVPLAAATAFALAWTAQGRFGRAWLATVVALLVKPTGIIVAGGLCLASLVCAWRTNDPGERRAAWWSACGHLVLGIAFVVELAVASSFGVDPPSVGIGEGLVPLFGKRLWTTPDFGLAFVAGIGCLPFAFVRIARGKRSNELATPDHVASASRGSPIRAGAAGSTSTASSAIMAGDAGDAGRSGNAGPMGRAEITAAAFVLAYAVFFANYTNVLPRYFLQVAPALVAVLVGAALALRVRPRSIAMAGALFALFGASNARGVLYPTQMADWSDPRSGEPLVAANGWLVERSLELRDDQRLLGAIVERARAFDPERTVLVAPWPVQHALAVPRLGYVETPLVTSCAEVPLALAQRTVPFDSLYAQASGRWRRTSEREIVWILVPNVFAGEMSRPMEGDEVLATIASGRLRAFFVRRTAWE